MAELKTKKTTASVSQFIDTIEDEQKRDDCRTVVKMMKKATGAEPTMWGAAIVGFGKYRYTYSTGKELDWFQVGFSPRKQALTLYVMPTFSENSAFLKKLGKFKTGKGCLYVKSLNDVDLDVLQKLIETSVKKLTN